MYVLEVLALYKIQIDMLYDTCAVSRWVNYVGLEAASFRIRTRAARVRN